MVRGDGRVGRVRSLRYGPRRRRRVCNRDRRGGSSSRRLRLRLRLLRRGRIRIRVRQRPWRGRRGPIGRATAA